MNVGDEVTRMLGGTVPMKLKVTAITDERIICGPWEFDKKTGAEIDEDFEIAPSYIEMPGITYVMLEAEPTVCSGCGFMKCQC
jgi:hypothetical protein